MNYPPNTYRWQPGDRVLHDADAKEEAMLMVVLGYHPQTGECRTRYLHPVEGVKKNKVWRNDPRVLHDPHQFGVALFHEGDQVQIRSTLSGSDAGCSGILACIHGRNIDGDYSVAFAAGVISPYPEMFIYNREVDGLPIQAMFQKVSPKL